MSHTVTAADIAVWSKFNALAGAEETLLTKVVTAVAEHIEANYVVADPFTDAQEIALMLQVSRLWKRRLSPEGVASFADTGPFYVTRLDNDVAALLTPVIGFA